VSDDPRPTQSTREPRLTQPLVLESGIIRFRKNAIVRRLLDESLKRRLLRTEAEAVGFIQRCRHNCVLLDARQRFVGAAFLSSAMGWSRKILLMKESENVPCLKEP
jgi:hypothetical protein